MLLIFLCMSIGMIMAQITKVTGIVLDADTNEPIVGASVLIKGTSTGTITDANGRYEIVNLPKGSKSLMISFVGMRTIELPITSSNTQQVMMRPDAQLIDDVVVVAYGTAKRESITGAIASVNTKELEKRPISNAVGALEGTTTGIQINNTNGEPGSTPEIRIRGYNTVNGSNAPLYIVDGIPMGGETCDISPNDIESISVLKDAASAAMYGSRAANGVVLITTKKGKSEKMRIKLSTNQGFYSRMFPEYEKFKVIFNG